ncbi:MAG: endopeptidase La [Bacteroidales bacterium]|nr:endopeptidase La [Bacteroidales bacterium]MCR5364012.1 endopeptidase La [Bacteroidales bacterium]
MSIISVTADGGVRLNDRELPGTLPVLALRNTVVFPGTIAPVMVSREASLALVNEASKKDLFIAACPQKHVETERPSRLSDFTGYGVIAKVIKVFEMPDGTSTAILQAFKRVLMVEVFKTNHKYLDCMVNYLQEELPAADDVQIPLLVDMLKEDTAKFLAQSPLGAADPLTALKEITDFSFLVNFVATTVELDSFEGKAELLSISDLKERGLKLLTLLRNQLAVLQMKQEINSKVKSDIDQQQREYYLNSQLRTIQEELGMDDEEDFTRMRDEAKKKQWPKEVAATFEKELRKLERFNPSAPEYSIQYNFLQFFLELPWGHVSKDNMDLTHAQKVLDEDHFGLEKVKERIIEYLAVLKLKGDMKSPILCLYGPPGVGKTSLGKSIARALGRKYVRISLGGVHDEAEIRGHRKTYVGALPGRIINAIHKAGTSNPVIVLDEVDKIGADGFKGDPSSALLEALDPEQNTAFHDNYLDVDYDLSKVLFITTANTTSTIQPALQDRMEMINVTGYIEEEKMEIARKFLLPKQLKEHGLKRGQLKVDKGALEAIIDDYTRESGVRGLEKQIAKLARVTARKIAMNEELPYSITKNELKEYLGLPTAFHDKQDGNELPGVVTGLAWTAMGGEILFIESSVSEGKGVLSTTGNLGDVMKESAQIAYQYIKAHPEVTGLTAEEFAKRDVHLHVPEGAVPKDGPSAGITMVSSMVSAFRGKSVKKGIAMTGEMTLRGRVLPVGGIKEKILAAKRAGVHTIFISSENKKDIEDINEIYVKGLTFVYVDSIDDVIKGIF